MIFGVKTAFEAEIVVDRLNKLHDDWKKKSDDWKKTRRVSRQSAADASALEDLKKLSSPRADAR